MIPATRIVCRGEFVFTITVTREPGRRMNAAGRGARSVAPGSAAEVVHVTVSKDGQRVDAGRLELFSPEYLASRRYKLAFNRYEVKPVGRVGKVLIGPDASDALAQALASAHVDLANQAAATAAGHANWVDALPGGAAE